MKMQTARRFGLAIGAALCTVLCISVNAAGKPIKETLYAHYGWEVAKQKTVCIVASEACAMGRPSNELGGFEVPHAIAINSDAAQPAHYDHLYVVDQAHRIQELSKSGEPVGVYGWDVNETKDKESQATQAEKNVCVVSSHDACGAGVSGDAPGQINEPTAITVDAENGNVYVAEVIFGPNGQTIAERVQEFSADGRFLLEIGAGVNRTNHSYLCTAGEIESGTLCGGPTQHAVNEDGIRDHGSFEFASGARVLSVGGPAKQLYVGELGRLQEFEQDGKYAGEVSLKGLSSSSGSFVQALAVDPSGDVYLTYYQLFEERNGELQDATEHAALVYKLTPTGDVINELRPDPRLAGAHIEILALVLYGNEGLAITEFEESALPLVRVHRGALYVAHSSAFRLMTEFSDATHENAFGPEGINDLAISDSGNMYATIFDVTATGDVDEVAAYTPVTVGELLPGQSRCTETGVHESSVVMGCELRGEVNPEGVAQTDVWFEWGNAVSLGTKSPIVRSCDTVCGELPTEVPPVTVDGLEPNEKMYFRMAAQDAEVKGTEILTSPVVPFSAPAVAPRVARGLSASFIRPFSAVLLGEVNPENSTTEYFFEYMACDRQGKCGVGQRTSLLSSNVYGRLRVALEAKDLRPSTVYHYRINAINDNGQVAVAEDGSTRLPEGQFVTQAAPAPSAATGAAIVRSPVAVLLSGTVNSHGDPAIYRFELGVAADSGIEYSTVTTGSVSAGLGSISETTEVTGLQPGTRYAYRLSIDDAYGVGYGTYGTFTTPVFTSEIEPPTQLVHLPVPKIADDCRPKGGRSMTRKCGVGRTKNVKRRSKRRKRGTKRRRS